MKNINPITNYIINLNQFIKIINNIKIKIKNKYIYLIYLILFIFIYFIYLIYKIYLIFIFNTIIITICLSCSTSKSKGTTFCSKMQNFYIFLTYIKFCKNYRKFNRTSLLLITLLLSLLPVIVRTLYYTIYNISITIINIIIDYTLNYNNYNA